VNSRPPLEVADIFRQYGDDFRERCPLLPEQRRVMRAIEVCRTSVLGGHLEQCDSCAYQRVAYNSCRNRHCPKCQALAQRRWVEARLVDLLPVPYFHVVFTLPEQLAMVALQNKRVVYNLLFATAAKTLRTIAADPKHLGAQLGFLAVLHTWSQNTPSSSAPALCSTRRRPFL
jgi:Transposase zinc-binding domain